MKNFLLCGMFGVLCWVVGCGCGLAVAADSLASYCDVSMSDALGVLLGGSYRK